MALLAVLVAVLVAFVVCWPPTEFAAPATAFRVPAAFEPGPQAGRPVFEPASIGDAPATPPAPATGAAPATTPEPVMPLARPWKRRGTSPPRECWPPTRVFTSRIVMERSKELPMGSCAPGRQRSSQRA